MQQNLDPLIHDIYDTVVDTALWPSVLDRVADCVGARGCILFEWEGGRGNEKLVSPHMSARYDPARLDAYLGAFHALESEDQDRFEALSLQSDGIDLIEDTALFESEAEMLSRPNVQAMMSFGMRHRCAGLLDKDNPALSRFSAQFSAEHGPMTDEGRARFATLLPHIAKALDRGRAARCLAATQNTMIAAMDMLRIGVCILDAGGRVAASNLEFQRQCDSYDTFRTLPDGTFSLSERADRARFAALLDGAQNHGKFGARPRKEAIAIDADGGFDALCIEVVPLEQSEEIGSQRFGGFALFSQDTSLPVALDIGPLRQVFGLTDTEAALAGLLADGMTNAQLAESRGRSVATVNSQVKTLLSKTQCANRTQLVRVLTSYGMNYLKSDG